jgi:hypothetical protein
MIVSHRGRYRLCINNINNPAHAFPFQRGTARIMIAAQKTKGDAG